MSSARHGLSLAAVLIGTPALQLAINPNLFVNPGTNLLIDPWIYSGFFFNLPEQARLFPDTYYGSRLSVILPGYAAHSLFAPLTASHVLHVGYFVTLLAATGLLVRRGLNAGAGLLTMTVMAWNPIVLSAIGWDYVDGAGIVFLVASLCCFECAAHGGPRRHAWAASGGALTACLVTANIFLLVAVPLLAFFLWMRSRGSLRAVGPAAAAGALAAFAAFSLASVQLGGSWRFLAPQFREGQTLVAVRNPWQLAGYAWLLHATWLVLPLMAAIGATLSLVPWVRARSELNFAVAVHWLLVAALMVWLIIQAVWTPVLQISYYSSYLAPLAVLSLSMHAVAGEEETPGRVDALLLAGVVVFAAGAWIFLADTRRVGGALELIGGRIPLLTALDAGHFPASVATLAALVAAVATIAAVRAAEGLAVRWLALTVGLSLTFVAAPQFWQTADGPPPGVRYEITADAHRYISGQLDGRRLRVWYRLAPDTARPVKSIASTFLWGYVLVNEALPELTAQQAATLTDGTRLVLLAADAGEVEAARGGLRRVGFDFRPLTERRFGEGDWAVDVVVGDLVRSAGPSIQ